MKNLIMIFAIATGTNAFASNGQLMDAYNLSFFNIAEQSTLPKTDTVLSGQILLNSTATELEMVLDRDNVCQAKICPMMAMAPFQVTLPILSVTTDKCGITTTIAEATHMKLEVVDHKTDTCLKNLLAIRTVSVTVTEQLANSNDTVVSTMSGLPAQN